ncbi:MAG: hypothetical protein K0Q49_1313 [Haloplasmataceae bacterium]|jgi:uncharacterized Zn finger protein (UPF0148 family)|nr:hypothetical protein [Haloplasmataceae bacterium]
MKYLCPECGNVLATDDGDIYTCLECDHTFTSDELAEEYGLNTSDCVSCSVSH